MANVAILTGYVGADPEINIYDGKTRATFKLATNEIYKDANGNKKNNTEWHSIVAWAGTADLIGKFLKKGHQVWIRGMIKYSYTDKEGIKTYYTNIVCKEIEFLNRPSTKIDNVKQPEFTGEYEENDLPF